MVEVAVKMKDGNTQLIRAHQLVVGKTSKNLYFKDQDGTVIRVVKGFDYETIEK